jgi:hypothetical protein
VRLIVEQISVLNYQTVYFNTVFIYESIFPKEQFYVRNVDYGILYSI